MSLKSEASSLKSQVGEPVLEMIGATIASSRDEKLAVVGGVNWTVREGTFWVVGGLPGAGKSALLLTAAGIQKPKQGEVRLFGRDLAGLREAELLRERRRVGLVFEGGGRLFADLTVAENVSLPYRYHHDCDGAAAADKVREALDFVELTAYADRRPGSVPRPLCCRIGLARALITGPEMLLLDNPLHGLDARQAPWWKNTIARLFAGPVKTVILAVDDLRPWAGADRKHALVEKGTWRELRDSETLTAAAELAAGEPPGA